MQTNQRSLHIKNSQKQLTTTKIFETKICKGVDRVRKFKVKSTANPYKRSRGEKKTRFAVHHVSKSCVITASHKKVAKTESQQREELRFHTSQSATTCSTSALLSLQQSLNNHFFRMKQKNKCKPSSDQVQLLHHVCAEKLQKTD